MKSKLLITCLILLSLSACKKDEQTATDILDTVAIPPKKVEVAKKPLQPKPVETIKTIAPTPTIAEPVKIAPTVEIKPIEPVKAPIQPKAVESIKPLVVKPEVINTPGSVIAKPMPVISKPIPEVIEPVKPVVAKPITKPVEVKKPEVVMSIEFD